MKTNFPITEKPAIAISGVYALAGRTVVVAFIDPITKKRQSVVPFCPTPGERILNSKHLQLPFDSNTKIEFVTEVW